MEKKIKITTTKKNFIKQNALLIAIILIGIGIIVTMIWTNNNRNYKLQEIENDKKFQKTMAKIDYDNCVKNAWSSYNDTWENACETLGRGKNCRLGTTEAEGYDTMRENAIEKCLELYKLEMK
mgnify:CR=1 FL=1